MQGLQLKFDRFPAEHMHMHAYTCTMQTHAAAYKTHAQHAHTIFPLQKNVEIKGHSIYVYI